MVPKIIFVRTGKMTPADRKKVDLIVIHTMEVPERSNIAAIVATRMASSDAQKSCHYFVDDEFVVQSVREEDVAWHAPGANRNGIGIEHAGYAGQNDSEWNDEYSLEMLWRSARLAADICNRWKIPPVRLTARELMNGERGITGHADVTYAFKKSDHTDPGPKFPWGLYMDLVLAAIRRST